MPSHIAAHARLNAGFTAGLEKRLLTWIARRLPPWVTSDRLSALGLAAMFAAAVSFAALRSTPWAAGAIVVSLAVNWFGDSLDGTVARVRRQERPRFGYYVDHAIDLAGTTVLMIGMAGSGLMNPLLALAVLVGYLLVSAESYLAAHAAGVFRMSFLGLGPTELRLLLASGAVKCARAPFIDLVGGPTVRLFDVGGIVALAGLAIAFGAAAVHNTRALHRAEPLPRPSRPTVADRAGARVA